MDTELTLLEIYGMLGNTSRFIMLFAVSSELPKRLALRLRIRFAVT